MVNPHIHTQDVDEAIDYLDGRVRHVFDCRNDERPKFTVTDAHMVKRVLDAMARQTYRPRRGVSTAR